jgi:hypothetical protein
MTAVAMIAAVIKATAGTDMIAPAPTAIFVAIGFVVVARVTVIAFNAHAHTGDCT